MRRVAGPWHLVLRRAATDTAGWPRGKGPRAASWPPAGVPKCPSRAASAQSPSAVRNRTEPRRTRSVFGGPGLAGASRVVWRRQGLGARRRIWRRAARPDEGSGRPVHRRAIAPDTGSERGRSDRMRMFRARSAGGTRANASARGAVHSAAAHSPADRSSNL